MTIITYSDISKSVASALTLATGVKRVEAHDEMSENVPVTPMLQVYPESGETDTVGENDRAVFNAAIRRSQTVIHVDGFARQRSYLGADIAAAVALVDAVDAVLIAQKATPFFGLADIQGFRWNWQRQNWKVNEIDYAGVKFIITLWIY